jgi:hypothetical protein
MIMENIPKSTDLFTEESAKEALEYADSIKKEYGKWIKQPGDL